MLNNSALFLSRHLFTWFTSLDASFQTCLVCTRCSSFAAKRSCHSSRLPFAYSVMSCLQHSSYWVRNGGSSQLWSQSIRKKNTDYYQLDWMLNRTNQNPSSGERTKPITLEQSILGPFPNTLWLVQLTASHISVKLKFMESPFETG